MSVKFVTVQPKTHVEWLLECALEYWHQIGAALYTLDGRLAEQFTQDNIVSSILLTAFIIVSLSFLMTK